MILICIPFGDLGRRDKEIIGPGIKDVPIRWVGYILMLRDATAAQRPVIFSRRSG